MNRLERRCRKDAAGVIHTVIIEPNKRCYTSTAYNIITKTEKKNLELGYTDTKNNNTKKYITLYPFYIGSTYFIYYVK